MANILNNNRHNLKIKMNYDEYWDFFLNKDSFSTYKINDKTLYDKCLISYIDATNKECIDGEWLCSIGNYNWENAIAKQHTLFNIGFTGVDNGLIRFKKDRISNKDFIKIFSESDFSFNENDFRLKLHQVSGNTMKYEYPSSITNEGIKCNGGFYQGVFETSCDKYQVLPSKLESGDVWEFEFVLKKEEFEKESEKTLNDKYADNKGLFFYIGTRSENKWIYLYDEKYIKETTLDTDDVIDDSDMKCDPNSLSRFSNLDWYDDLEEWRMELQESITGMNLDNFIDYKYYSDDLYQDVEHDSLDDYIMSTSKPLIIDYTTLYEDLKKCCNYSCADKPTKKINVFKKLNCCGCGKCREIKTIQEVKTTPKKCCSELYMFDDYLSDADDVFEWYGDTEYLENEVNLEMFDFQTMKYGLSLKNSNRYISIFSDNKFLLFHRACTGYTIGNWVEDTVVEYRQVKNNFNGNLFLLMNRTCTGYTVYTIDDLIETYNEKYNVYEDIYNNALAFRITDDGKIGYRYASIDCSISEENKVNIYEGYSNPNIISENKWHVIHVKLYSKLDKMFFKFYVDGKLKYVTQEIPKLNLRKLVEEDEKQECVPFNISLGGGTQGLCDVILPNYMRQYDYVFPLEKYFGGTFIGYIKKFRFYNCFMDYDKILNNYLSEKIIF